MTATDMTVTAITVTAIEPADESRDGGFVVVVALWLLAALAALAIAAAIYMTQSAKALTAYDADIQAEMLTTAGIELAAFQLSTPTAVHRPTRGRFTFTLARSHVLVEYLSEAARINLNMARKDMISGLFDALGADPQAADEFADRVVAWRSAPKPSVADAEDELYRSAGLSYLPRRAPFNNVNELYLLPGLPPALVERALPFVTVFSGMAEINVLDAAPEVVAALPDMTPARLQAFLDERASLPREPQAVLDALGGRQIGATTAASDAYRVRERLTLPNGQQKTSEGVIQILDAGEKEAYQVLAWRDEF